MEIHFLGQFDALFSSSWSLSMVELLPVKGMSGIVKKHTHVVPGWTENHHYHTWLHPSHPKGTLDVSGESRALKRWLEEGDKTWFQSCPPPCPTVSPWRINQGLPSLHLLRVPSHELRCLRSYVPSSSALGSSNLSPKTLHTYIFLTYSMER